MTTFTFRADAEALIQRVKDAPDSTTDGELLDEMLETHLSIATATQMLAESNERWSRDMGEFKASVREWLAELIEEFNGLEDSEPFKSICNLVDFDLVEEYSYTIVARLLVTATAPRGMSESVVRGYIDAGSNINDVEPISNSDKVEVASYGYGDWEIEIEG